MSPSTSASAGQPFIGISPTKPRSPPAGAGHAASPPAGVSTNPLHPQRGYRPTRSPPAEVPTDPRTPGGVPTDPRTPGGVPTRLLTPGGGIRARPNPVRGQQHPLAPTCQWVKGDSTYDIDNR